MMTTTTPTMVQRKEYCTAVLHDMSDTFPDFGYSDLIVRFEWFPRREAPEIVEGSMTG